MSDKLNGCDSLYGEGCACSCGSRRSSTCWWTVITASPSCRSSLRWLSSGWCCWLSSASFTVCAVTAAAAADPARGGALLESAAFSVERERGDARQENLRLGLVKFPPFL